MQHTNQDRKAYIFMIAFSVLVFCFACTNKKNVEISQKRAMTAATILGNPKYLAISYGGYRETSRAIQPTIVELKEDLKILSAMGIKIIRTYNVQPTLPHASNVLKAIRELKREDPNFEMYVMLGAWIDCLNAWTETLPDHNFESPQNAGEIDRAVALAKEYPEIVKVIAVGNEAMVKWAASYFVQPAVILKWVTHLQDLKKKGQLPKDLWITSSDDFSSWGGGDPSYHTEDLEKLMKAVDYVSMHTYPYHNTHYNPEFWGIPAEEHSLSEIEKIEKDSVTIKTSDKNISIPNDYVALTGYLPDFKFLKNSGITLSNDEIKSPNYNPETMESNVKNLYLAGVICGGKETHKWFIENSRVHAKIIANHIEKAKK